MAKTQTDKYANCVGRLVSPYTAGNPPLSAKIDFGLSIQDKVGILIRRVEFDIWCIPLRALAGDNDYLIFGISAWPPATVTEAEEPNNPAWVIRREIKLHNMGGAANVEQWLYRPTLDVDLSGMPGGGLIVPPSTLYAVICGSIHASGQPIKMDTRMFFTVETLTTEDYWQLVESRRMIPQA